MTSPATTLRDELIAVETAYWEALRSRNATRLGELSADTMTLVMADGVFQFDRDEYVQMMTGGDFRLEAFHLDTDNASVYELGEGVAVLTFRVNGNYWKDGQMHRSDSFNSATWIDSAGQWMCAFATESLVADTHAAESAK